MIMIFRLMLLFQFQVIFHFYSVLLMFPGKGLCCPASCQLCTITRVHCNSLGLHFIPRNLPESTTVLFLSGNNISQVLPEDFKRLEKLSVLFLNNTGLVRFAPKALKHLHRLYYLHLNNNLLQHLEPDTFVGLSNLHFLYLHHNEIQYLPDKIFNSLPALNLLELQGNKLKTISCQALFGMSRLKTLNLANNMISFISSLAFTNLGKLEILSIKGNLLCQIPSRLFEHLGNLKWLDLSGNPIKLITSASLKGLKNLLYLSVENAKIKHIDIHAFDELKKLKHLVLSNNYINVIYPNTFSFLKHLKYLHLDRNNISNLHSKTFYGVAFSLKLLNLRDNKLAYLHSNVFRSLDSLIFVNVSKNPWQCDCRLLELRNWLVSSSVMMNVHCQHPPHLQDRLLRYINIDEFGACIVSNYSYNFHSTSVYSVTNDAKLTSNTSFLPLSSPRPSTSFRMKLTSGIFAPLSKKLFAYESTTHVTSQSPLEVSLLNVQENITALQSAVSENLGASVPFQSLITCEKKLAKLNQSFDILLGVFVLLCALVVAMTYKLLNLRHRLNSVNRENVVEYFSFFHSGNYSIRAPPQMDSVSTSNLVGNAGAGQIQIFRHHANGNQAQVILFEHSVL
ncbi:leucine-rich repeat-containing protein 70-like [Polypterus senegalus]|uniref:leucine-rich repeat-containing protein 70-like n=1 Tax=Polypterus senegalus TaxID=55291 RepID=UPI001962FB86|nr:leucine-rich repeat-containing protein 70-like [Polypterus senegalus]